MLTCQICGKSNTEDARFCYGCGSPLSQAPPVRVDVRAQLKGVPTPVPTAPSVYTPSHVWPPLPRAGSCYYHPDLPSSFVCSRCGRSICAGCNKPYGVLSFCPECFWGLAPRIGYPAPPYPAGYQQQETRRSLF